MEFVSGLALVLLTLVGFSSGAVLGARRKTPVPHLPDLLVIVALWIAALLTRPALGKWQAIAVWLVAGMVVGVFTARARLDQYPKASAEAPARTLWEAWKGFARRMGNFQSRMLMSFLYFTVVLPFGLAVTGLSDPLHIKRIVSQSNWQPKHLPAKPSLDEAGRQF
jgi:hypothetical protein